MSITELKKLAAASPLYAVAGLSFFMGLVLAGFMGGRTANNLFLMKMGQSAEGRVVRVIHKLTSEGGGASVYVDFSVDGRTYSGRRDSRSSAWQPGETATVLYRRRNPNRFILEQEVRMASHWKENAGMTAVGLILLLAGAKGTFRWIARSRDLGILSKRGRRFPGKIAEIKKRGYKSGNYTPVYFSYSFEGLSGRELHGESENLPKALAGKADGNLLFTVLQDPEKPSRHMADVWSIRTD